MNYSRTVIMGNPTHFHIKSGANPHTRTKWGFKKKVDQKKAKAQWQSLAETLIQYGVQIYVVPPNPRLPGLVFPANAGFLPKADETLPLSGREYMLANLSAARSPEQDIYVSFLQSLGLKVRHISSQFEGEADLIRWRERYLFTYGPLQRQRFRPQWGWPPWKRVYGFRSDERACLDFYPWVPLEQIIPLELINESHYHGDTVLCSFGPEREYLLVYAGGLTAISLQYFEKEKDVIWISETDAELFAANSFQVIHQGQCSLFMPDGVSTQLRNEIEKRHVATVSVNVSEFFEKGGGSVKCLIGDMGASAGDEDIDEATRRFREEHLYKKR